MKNSGAAFEEAQKKWNGIYQNAVGKPEPARILTEYAYLLPKTGRALDLACGLGGNALYLAEKTAMNVEAWDCSSVALSSLDKRVAERGLRISSRVTAASEIGQYPDSFDLVIISRYLDRVISNDLIAALKPGGLLFYQTFCLEKEVGVGPNNPDYLLRRNELLNLFAGLMVLVYHEDAQVGNPAIGHRNEAYLVAQKT